jgi:AcrR family transcriptional regulator
MRSSRMNNRLPPETAVSFLETSRPTQAERREAAEHAILEAAKTILAERGLDELTLNEAGEMAGYSRALPAHYFKTRSALLHALADHITESYASRLRAIVGPDEGLEGLIKVIEFCLNDCERDPKSVRAFQIILGAGLTKPEIAPLVTRLNKQSIDDFAALIRISRDRGEVRADARARAEASHILASLRGVMFQWLMDPTHVPLSHVRDSLVASIRKSLAP